MKTTLVIVSVLSLALAAPAAMAGDDHAKKFDEWFEKIDTNKDGKLSKTELPAEKPSPKSTPTATAPLPRTS